MSQSHHFEALRALALAFRTHDVPCHHSLCILQSLPDIGVHIPVSVAATKQRPVSLIRIAASLLASVPCISLSGVKGSSCGPSCCTWRRCTCEIHSSSHFTSESSMAAQQWIRSPHSLALKGPLPDYSVLRTVSATSSRPSRIAKDATGITEPRNTWMCIIA